MPEESQSNGTLAWFVSLIIAAALLMGVADLPYGYYEILRGAVTIVSGLKAYDGVKSGRLVPVAIFGILTVLFNPLIPIHMRRDDWHGIDVACAPVFLIDAFLSLRRERRIKAKSLNPAPEPKG